MIDFELLLRKYMEGPVQPNEPQMPGALDRIKASWKKDTRELTLRLLMYENELVSELS
jgi:hypothetical protein